MLCHCATHCNSSLPFWCSPEQTTEIELNKIEKKIPRISMNCSDLLANCQNKGTKRSGYCFFYDKTCNQTNTWTGKSTLEDMDHLYPHMLPRPQSKKNRKRFQLEKQCISWKRRCDNRKTETDDTYACRNFKKRCNKFDNYSFREFSIISVLLLNVYYFY